MSAEVVGTKIDPTEIGGRLIFLAVTQVLGVLYALALLGAYVYKGVAWEVAVGQSSETRFGLYTSGDLVVSQTRLSTDYHPALRRTGAALSTVLFIVLVLTAVPARAEIARTAQAAGDKYTAAILYDECNHPASSVQKAHCNGFVHGFLVGAQTGFEVLANRGSLFCGDTTPAIAQLVVIFQMFVRAHPEALPLEAEVALVGALENAFPCHGRAKGINP
jgi:hypothetical protein